MLNQFMKVFVIHVTNVILEPRIKNHYCLTTRGNIIVVITVIMNQQVKGKRINIQKNLTKSINLLVISVDTRQHGYSVSNDIQHQSIN